MIHEADATMAVVRGFLVVIGEVISEILAALVEGETVVAVVTDNVLNSME